MHRKGEIQNGKERGKDDIQKEVEEEIKGIERNRGKEREAPYSRR